MQEAGGCPQGASGMGVRGGCRGERDRSPGPLPNSALGNDSPPRRYQALQILLMQPLRAWHRDPSLLGQSGRRTDTGPHSLLMDSFLPWPFFPNPLVLIRAGQAAALSQSLLRPVCNTRCHLRSNDPSLNVTATLRAQALPRYLLWAAASLWMAS